MRKLLKDKVALISLCIILIVIFAGLFAPFFAMHDPNKQDIFNKYAQMSLEYPFGTDNLGRCVYSRLVYGIRTTIFLSILAVFCTVGLGVLLGLISGFFGKLIDEFIMRLCDCLLSFPSLVIILAIVGILGAGIENVIIANVIMHWPWHARMVRGSVMKYRHKNYIMYSCAIGTNKRYIIFRHLLPNIFVEAILFATLEIGCVIMSISALSFLGLGVQPPTPEWGAMLSEAKNIMLVHPEQMLAPGIAILVVVACFNFLGDSIRDILDVKESSHS